MNYKNAEAYEEVNLDDIERGANLISSHQFFTVKNDGESGKLKLKCRMVPHENRDKEKELVRKDSSTAQFPILRLLISL